MSNVNLKPNCSLLNTTRSNISSAVGASDSNSRHTAPPIINVVDIDVVIQKRDDMGKRSTEQVLPVTRETMIICCNLWEMWQDWDAKCGPWEKWKIIFQKHDVKGDTEQIWPATSELLNEFFRSLTLTDKLSSNCNLKTSGIKSAVKIYILQSSRWRKSPVWGLM